MEEEQKSKRKGLPIWAWIIIVIFVLMVIGRIGSGNTSSTSTTEPDSVSPQQPSTSTSAPTSPPIQVSDEELTNEYVNNQFSADEKYKDRVLDVSGTVATVDRDVFGNPYVSLKNSQFMEDTVFHFTNDATDTASLANVSVGQSITIQGTCKGKVSTEVDMENCSIIPNNQTSQGKIQTNQQTAQSIPISISTQTLAQTPSGEIVPPQYEINAEMRRMVEVNDPSINFIPDKAVTVSDENEGWITAIHGTRNPSADGYGQLIFLWHNEQFIGCDATYESDQSRITDSGPGYFVISYAHYAENDPMASPSLPWVNITYTWNGTDFTSSGSPPTNIYGSYEESNYVKYIS